MTDDDLSTLLADLHAHLEATAELPVEPRTSAWLGEAEAVAADVARGDASHAVVRTRIEQVRHLLREVEGTGNPEADAHVAAARDLSTRIEARLDDGDGG